MYIVCSSPFSQSALPYLRCTNNLQSTELTDSGYYAVCSTTFSIYSNDVVCLGTMQSIQDITTINNDSYSLELESFTASSGYVSNPQKLLSITPAQIQQIITESGNNETGTETETNPFLLNNVSDSDLQLITSHTVIVLLLAYGFRILKGIFSERASRQ